MLDLRQIRNDPDTVKAALKKRGDESLLLAVDEIRTLDETRRAAIGEVEELKARRNEVSKEIGRLKREGADAEAPIMEMRGVGEKIAELDALLTDSEGRIREILLGIPNMPLDAVPEGGEEANQLVREWGEEPSFSFEPKPHWDLGEALGILDLPRGAKISGSGFPLLKGRGARLQRGLVDYMLDFHTTRHGYQELRVPYLVTAETMTGTGQLPKFAEESYVTQRDELWLIPTAEVPVTNLHRDEILAMEEMPVRYTAYTPCFRREAGAAGKDTRGLLRVHQFDKVELVRYEDPRRSLQALEELTGEAESILQALGLRYRVLLLAAGDLGSSSAMTYDLEVWAPGVGRWLEVSSCSIFTDYQARRANLRFRRGSGEKPEFVHTLNGSAPGSPAPHGCPPGAVSGGGRECGSSGAPPRLPGIFTVGEPHYRDRPSAVRRRRWPIALAVLFVAELVWYLFYTESIVRALRSDARDLTQIYAQVQEGIGDPSPGAAEDALYRLQSIILEGGVPLVQTGVGDTVLAAANLPFEADLAIPSDYARVRNFARRLDLSHSPVGDPEVALLHFGDPPELRNLRWIPWLQAFGLLLTAALGALLIQIQRRAEGEKAWTAMARELAHQLGTPLSALQGWLEILRLPSEDRPQGLGSGEIASEIEADLHRLERISNRFELIGREPELEEVDLRDILEGLQRYLDVRLPRLAAGVVLESDLEPGLPKVAGNAVLLTWALENVVKNALDALGGRGGTIRIRARRGERGMVRISVTDTGPGVPAELKREIFEPGVTSKARGWGVGLALSRRIVEGVHKGRIELGEEEGPGATFHLHLPSSGGDRG